MSAEWHSVTGKASFLPKTWWLTWMPTQHPIQWLHSALSPGDKQVGWEPNHSPPSRATVTNLMRYIPMTPLAITAKHRDKSTVTLPPPKIVSNTLQTYRLRKLCFLSLTEEWDKIFSLNHQPSSYLNLQFQKKDLVVDRYGNATGITDWWHINP